jgi:hypothetical protein
MLKPQIDPGAYKIPAPRVKQMPMVSISNGVVKLGGITRKTGAIGNDHVSGENARTLPGNSSQSVSIRTEVDFGMPFNALSSLTKVEKVLWQCPINRCALKRTKRSIKASCSVLKPVPEKHVSVLQALWER